MLHHVSEDSGILRFEPRPAPGMDDLPNMIRQPGCYAMEKRAMMFVSQGSYGTSRIKQASSTTRRIGHDVAVDAGSLGTRILG
jgi:hypothetical protein